MEIRPLSHEEFNWHLEGFFHRTLSNLGLSLEMNLISCF